MQTGRRPAGKALRACARVGLGALLAVAIESGCSEDSRLGVGGASSYARCLGRGVADHGPARIGALALTVEDAVLSIAGLPALPRLAAFAGPGPGPAPWAKAGSGAPPGLSAAKPDLVLVLGDLGDDPRLARATAAALDRLGVPVLVVGGGRDGLAALSAADALPNVIDVSPLHAVRLIRGAGGPKRRASYSLIPVAGALDGRYARPDEGGRDGCGYSEDDLEDRDLPKPEPGERRLLAAWQAPVGLDREHAPGDAGSPSLAAFSQRVGAGGGLFAWPHAQAGRLRSTRDGSPRAAGAPVDDLALIVPRLAGPSLERADGSHLAPGFALIELASSGPVLRDLTAHARP